MSKTFHFQADGEIEAESIDDCFAKLAEHFQQLANGNDEPGIVLVGTMGLEPVAIATTVKEV